MLIYLEKQHTIPDEKSAAWKKSIFDNLSYKDYFISIWKCHMYDQVTV